MLETIELVLISNALVTIGIFLATLYRIKIERKQVEIIIKNANSAEKLRKFQKMVEAEREMIEEMKGHEFLELLEKLFEDEN